jgi:hypothetical protein
MTLYDSSGNGRGSIRTDGNRDILEMGAREISLLELEAASPQTLARVGKIMVAAGHPL